MFAKRARPQQRRRAADGDSGSGEEARPVAETIAETTAPPTFGKRSRPGQPPQSRRRSPSSGAEENAAPAQAPPQRRLLTLDEDEADGDGFKVKKSKLSRQMSRSAATGARLVVANGASGTYERAGRKGLASKTGRRPRDEAGIAEVLASSGDEAAASPGAFTGELGEVREGFDEDELEDDEDAAPVPASMTGQAARVARAQRAAAREVYGSAAGRGGVTDMQADYIPLVKPPSHSAADSALSKSAVGGSPFEKPSATVAAVQKLTLAKVANEVDTDAADDWAMLQMRVGAHRRYGGLPSDIDEGALAGPGGPVPAAQREAVPMARQRGDTAHRAPGEKSSRTNEQEATQRGADVVSPADALAKMWETVRRLEKGEQERSGRGKELEEQRADAVEHLDGMKKEGEGFERVLQAVQRLDSFAQGLAGLIDEKAPKLKQAHDTLAQMERDFAAKRTRRRRRDLVAALRAAGATLSAGDDGDGAEASPRAEGPRNENEEAGWETSDAEEDGLDELAADRAAFCNAAHKQIAADVSDEFTETRQLLQPLEGAKKELAKGEYTQAYIPLSLPEALSLHVEHSMLWWDPLRTCQPQSPAATGEGGASSSAKWGPRRPLASVQLENFEWFEDLSAFTELQGDADADGELVPQIVRRCIFPEVGRRLRECWDVTSVGQGQRVAELLDECLLFETDEAAAAYAGLLKDAFDRLEAGLSELAPEVFVPANVLSQWYASSARWRLLWRSCKLARCALLLEGRVSDEKLAPLVLRAIFQTRIAPHLRAPRLDAREMTLVERFAASLPERWLASGLPPALLSLRDALGPRAPRGPEAAATAEQAVRVLRRLRCFDEAQALERTANSHA